MTTFQLDENANSRKFADECVRQGLCGVRRFPSSLRGTKDADLLPQLMSASYPLLTFDRQIAQNNSEQIPERNPGILIVTDPGSVHTLTVETARNILLNFKTVFTEWHKVSWRNSIVAISPSSVEVSRLAAGQLTTTLMLQLADHNVARRLSKTLQENKSPITG